MDKGTFSADILSNRVSGYATVSFRIEPDKRVISVHAREAGLVFDIRVNGQDAYRLALGVNRCPASLSIYRDTQDELESLNWENHEGGLNLIRNKGGEELALVFFPTQGEITLVRFSYGGAEFLKYLMEKVA